MSSSTNARFSSRAVALEESECESVAVGGGAENAVERETGSGPDGVVCWLWACASFWRTVDGCTGVGAGVPRGFLRGKVGAVLGGGAVGGRVVCGL